MRSFLECSNWGWKTHPNLESIILWARVFAYTCQWPPKTFRIKSNFLSRISENQMACLHLPHREHPVRHPELTNSLLPVFELLFSRNKTYRDLENLSMLFPLPGCISMESSKASCVQEISAAPWQWYSPYCSGVSFCIAPSSTMAQNSKCCSQPGTVEKTGRQGCRQMAFLFFSCASLFSQAGR